MPLCFWLHCIHSESYTNCGTHAASPSTYSWPPVILYAYFSRSLFRQHENKGKKSERERGRDRERMTLLKCFWNVLRNGSKANRLISEYIYTYELERICLANKQVVQRRAYRNKFLLSECSWWWIYDLTRWYYPVAAIANGLERTHSIPYSLFKNIKCNREIWFLLIYEHMIVNYQDW